MTRAMTRSVLPPADPVGVTVTFVVVAFRSEYVCPVPPG
jgi:hypothetical protein